MIKVYIWYLTLLASLCYPPLLLITGVPLAYSAIVARRGIREARALGEQLRAQQARDQELRDAQAVRKLLS